MVLLDGKKVSSEIIEKIKIEIENLHIKIGFAVIWIGKDTASNIYVNNKIKKCESVGIKTHLYHLDENISEEYVLNLIEELNNREDIHGILLQSPIPKHIDINKCFNKICPLKDIDGFSKTSCSDLFLGKATFVPCTAKGIMKLFDYYNIDLSGKDVCIINRSNLIGKPLFHLLIERDATVTMCHSKTKNLANHTLSADIVISAVGKPNFITEDMIKKDAIVIDAGISLVDGKVVGDVNFKNVSKKTSYITPVPGGIGPMTIAMVLDNIINGVKVGMNNE